MPGSSKDLKQSVDVRKVLGTCNICSWEFQSIPPTRSVLGDSLGLGDHSSRVAEAMEAT